MNKMINHIPTGHTKEDIKAREKLIKDFYAQWIAEHPEKKVWNRSLGAFINVKFLSINEKLLIMKYGEPTEKSVC